MMLDISNICAGYGSLRVVSDASLTIQKGQIATLIGPNGAGKSTLLKAISGLVNIQEGSIKLNGAEIVGLKPHLISRQGILHVPEGRQVFGLMTVEENLLLGTHALGTRPSRDDDAETLAQIFRLFPILQERKQQEAGSLSGGQQQMLAIGRALMGRPQLLMLDEPSLGLAPLVAKQVFDALVELNKGGLTILLIEQNARMALAVSQYAYVIESGRLVNEGPSEQLARDPEIEAHYLGHGKSPAGPSSSKVNLQVVL